MVMQNITITDYINSLPLADPKNGELWLNGDTVRISGAAPLTEIMVVALGDETTSITAGNAKLTFRMPYGFVLTGVRASLNTASTSGIPTIDINKDGVSVLSTKLTLDANEKTSTTAVIPAVISIANLADDSEITIDVDAAGTGAKGLKVSLIGYRLV